MGIYIPGHEGKSVFFTRKRQTRQKKGEHVQKYIQKVGKYFVVFEKCTLICATVGCMKGLEYTWRYYGFFIERLSLDLCN